MMHCPVCRSQTERFDDAQMQCTTYRCPQCRLMFKDAACCPDETTELKKYLEHDNSLENEGYVQMFESFIDWTLTSLDRPPRSVLDYGSGPEPVLAELLRRRGFSVQIYDKYFAPTPPKAGETFDLITCTEVIEHTADPLAFLRTLLAHLNVGGYVSLMTLFHADDLDAYLSWWYRRDPTHLCFFTPTTFETLAAQCGAAVKTHDEKRRILMRKTS